MSSIPKTTQLGSPPLQDSVRVAAPAHSPAKSKPKDSPEDLRRACQQFEEIFLRMLFKEAHIDRALSSEEDGAKLYGDLLIESLAKSAASSGGIGISELLYKEFAKDISSPTTHEKPSSGNKNEPLHRRAD